MYLSKKIGKKKKKIVKVYMNYDNEITNQIRMYTNKLVTTTKYTLNFGEFHLGPHQWIHIWLL